MRHAELPFSRPVIPGEPISCWKVSDVHQQAYDVAHRPMKGEMDPFFFVTKLKNFIPHEYPCRSEFIDEFRDKPVEPLCEPDYKQWYLAFGGDKLDLSGFWFRPTRIACWASIWLFSENQANVGLRLVSCGGLSLRVNGNKIGYVANYKRNLPSETDYTIELQAGNNLVEIYFDDLAERDTIYYLQLTQTSGPQLNAGLDLAVNRETAEEMERLLGSVAFDKPAYFQENEVTLEFAAASIGNYEVEVSVSGDFMSTEPPLIFRRKLGTGADKVTVAPKKDLPNDFRHFTVSLVSGETKLSRVIGVEIGDDWSSAEDLPVNERAARTLEHIADHGERDAVWAIAMYELGRQGKSTDKALRNLLPVINDCHDCADFVLTPLIFLRSIWPDAIEETLLAEIDKAILEFRYWMDEPGNDVQWYFSENHALLFHTCAYLGGHLLPDRTFTRSERTGREQSEVGYGRLVKWFDHFESCEMAEWNSSPYFPIDLKGLTSLYALAPHESIRVRAGKAINRLLELFAHSSHLGIMTASQGRSYEHSLRAGQTLELSGFAWVLWGRGGLGSRYHSLPQFILCLTRYELGISAGLQEIAFPGENDHYEWTLAQGQNAFVRLYHYKSGHFAMGSCADYRQDEWGYQETALHLRVGQKPRAQVWINHPGERKLCGYCRPSYWGGCGCLPRVQQYLGLALLEFDLGDHPIDFTHAWFPVAEFEEVIVEQKRILARSGKAFVLIEGIHPLTLTDTGPCRNLEVVQEGRHSRWLVRIGETDGLNLNEISDKFKGLAPEKDQANNWHINDPDYGLVLMSADGQVQAQGRSLNPAQWTIRGNLNKIKRSPVDIENGAMAQ